MKSLSKLVNQKSSKSKALEYSHLLTSVILLIFAFVILRIGLPEVKPYLSGQNAYLSPATSANVFINPNHLFGIIQITIIVMAAALTLGQFKYRGWVYKGLLLLLLIIFFAVELVMLSSWNSHFPTFDPMG